MSRFNSFLLHYRSDEHDCECDSKILPKNFHRSFEKLILKLGENCLLDGTAHVKLQSISIDFDRFDEFKILCFLANWSTEH